MAVTFNPSAINFTWTIGGTAASMTSPLITIAASNWEVRTPYGFTIGTFSGGQLEQPTANGGGRLYGRGSNTFTLVMSSIIVPTIITQNPVTYYLDINNGELSVPINVTFKQSSGLFLEKNYMYFEAYKGVNNALPQTNRLSFPQSYNFSLPSWLVTTPTYATNQQDISFAVTPAENIQAGRYEFDVLVFKFLSTVPLGKIRVVYNVVDAIISPYPDGKFAFTRDNKFITLTSDKEDAYYELALSGRVYEFYGQGSKDFIFNYKIPLFKKKQVFNIGLIMDRIMFRMDDLEGNSQIPYLPAEVNMKFTEKNFVDNSYSAEYNLPVTNFIAGLDPGLVGGCCFLDINTGATRVLANSVYYLHYLIRNTPYVNVYQNGEYIDGFKVGFGVNTLTMPFTVWQAAPGDIFEVRILTDDGNISKFFKVFPEGYNSNLIVWENEYKLKSSIDFTGKFTIKNDFDNRTQSLFLKLVDVLEKLESTKVSTLTINTGWLLKSDIPRIESLHRAKRAALVKDGKTINLVPTQKSMISSKDDQALISFDIEFQINRSYNEEVFAF